MADSTLHNTRMIEFMEYCIYHKVKNRQGVVPKTQGDFLTMIGFNYVGNLNQVLKGERGFRVHHISACCEVFGADANFFHLQKPAGMFTDKKLTPLQQLRAATKLIETEIKKR